MQYKVICLTILSLIGLNVSAAQAVQVCGARQQGGFVKLSAENLQKIELNGRIYKADEQGRLAMAFARDAELEQTLRVFYIDGSVETKKLALSKTNWDVQKINGVAQAKVTPSEADAKAIAEEQKAVSASLQYYNDFAFWNDDMIKPVEGRTSGTFGGQRIMNGVKKNPHQGWDIAAPEGSEVKASAGGVVTLSSGPYFYSGNMVVIDHGQNLSTIYAHLQKVAVKKGEKVEKGQIIGYVGMTGRATGPHLHLGASLNGVRFDARNLLDFAKDNCIDL